MRLLQTALLGSHLGIASLDFSLCGGWDKRRSQNSQDSGWPGRYWHSWIVLSEWAPPFPSSYILVSGLEERRGRGLLLMASLY